MIFLPNGEVDESVMYIAFYVIAFSVFKTILWGKQDFDHFTKIELTVNRIRRCDT